MKQKIALALGLLCLVSVLAACGGYPRAGTLTVEEVAFGQGLPNVQFTASGVKAELTPNDPGSWFSNAEFTEVIVPEGTSMFFSGSSTTLENGSHLLYVFTVDGTTYNVELANGTVFNVEQDEDGALRVLPGEEGWEAV